MADDPRAASLLKRFSTLQQQRLHWESHWQEIADFIIPRKADITKTRTPGDKRTDLVYDGTAIHAAELMSASLHGMLTNAATRWFSLRFGDDTLNGQGGTDKVADNQGNNSFADETERDESLTLSLAVLDALNI